MEPLKNKDVADHNNDETKSLTPTRETEVDIIKGASNTDQIEAMQANAAQSRQEQTSTSPANILEVNDGGTSNADGNISPSDDLQDPATRGI